MKRWVWLMTLAPLATLSVVALADDATSVELRLGVERALPVVGQPCRLWIATEDGKRPPQGSDYAIAFRIVAEQTHAVARELPADSESEGAAIASSSWTPLQTGWFQVNAKVTRRAGNGDSQPVKVTPLRVFVASRTLHFNYWQCRPEQRLVTSVMDNRATADGAVHWKQRGVRPLDWKGGQWHWARGYGSPEKMAALWTKVAPERDGIVIDEFGGGDDVDQQLGTALVLARSRQPTMFLAPYCLSVGGKQMTDGFRQANLVLVETYTPDWRWDGFITGRWQTAVDAGLTNKSVAVLGVGSQWIGTEKELRRVFRMVRATCPKMPGFGFFPDIPPRLTKAVDSAIEDYFLRPVVTVRVRGRRVIVHNIGETVAQRVDVGFVDSEGKRISSSKHIAQLKPWTELTLDLPEGAVAAVIEPAPDRYTTLAYTPPLQQPELTGNQQREALAFQRRVLRGNVLLPLKPDAKWSLVRTDDQHVRSATVPLPDSRGAAVAVSFEVCPRRCWFYGHNSVSLVGEGELTLTWARQDHDAGLEGNQPRPWLVFRGRDKYMVRDVSTIGFRQNETFHVLMSYDGRGTVRAMVTDRQETVLWDSGPVPADGGFRCNQLRFDVNPYPRSEIRLEAAQSKVLMRGGNGKADSPYSLESEISNLKVVSPK